MERGRVEVEKSVNRKRIPKLKMNMAAKVALDKGDIDNAITAMTPGGIEAQEAAGQTSFVNNSTLPINSNGGKPALEAFGIIYKTPVDDLFVNVELPAGWKKQKTDHSMSTDLLDENGIRRASIFYKAAFYDRDASISVLSRYVARVEPIGGYSSDSRNNRVYYAYIKDNKTGNIIWESDPLRPEPNSKEDREDWLKWIGKRDDELSQLVRNQLEERYPDYKNPAAYWDFP